MPSQSRKKWTWLGAVLLIIYLILPFAAGCLRVGNKLGPRIYPVDLHVLLYSIGYEKKYHTKPRVRVELLSMPRPWFYPLERKRDKMR